MYYNTPDKTAVYKSLVVDTSEAVVIDKEYMRADANGYRLPTEYEWEYAARYIDGATLNSGFATSGVGKEEDDAYSWYALNSDNSTHEVGLKKSNALGIYDMCGNVAELCFDQTSMSDGLTTNGADGTSTVNTTITINK